MTCRQWDIFCKVIDNFGDLGVCWRLSADLAARGERVRLWVDDASALAWMAPTGARGVEVLPWAEAGPSGPGRLASQSGQVLVEAFGCDIPADFVAAWVHQKENQEDAYRSSACWLNLEYLSAEAYVARCHAMPSPVMHGPATGWTKWFFYPGFTAQTGGLLREHGLMDRRAAFDAQAWQSQHGLANPASPSQQSQPTGAPLRVSLFSYEPPALKSLLTHWAQHGHAGQPVELRVTAGRSAQAVQAVLATSPGIADALLLRFQWLPWLDQADYDHLLWASDLNFVRGEDSLLRAVWAGQPFVWHIYPQEDGAHGAKLSAFLQHLGAPASLQAFHAAWNGLAHPLSAPQTGQATALASAGLRSPHAQELDAWRDWASATRTRLLAQEDLASRLLQFVVKSR